MRMKTGIVVGAVAALLASTVSAEPPLKSVLSLSCGSVLDTPTPVRANYDVAYFDDASYLERVAVDGTLVAWIVGYYEGNINRSSSDPWYHLRTGVARDSGSSDVLWGPLDKRVETYVRYPSADATGHIAAENVATLNDGVAIEKGRQWDCVKNVSDAWMQTASSVRGAVPAPHLFSGLRHR